MFYTLLNDSGQRLLTNLIGWLGLCLVVAGWGAELDSTTRQLGAHIGLIGLDAMIALKVMQWMRLINQQRATESRVELRLKRMPKGNETVAQLYAELRRLENEAHHYHETVMEVQSYDEPISVVHPWGQVNPLISDCSFSDAN